MPPANLVDPGPGSPTREDWAIGVHAWITYLNSLIGTTPTTVVNGGFEQYTGTNNVPDNWVFTPFTGGAGALDNSQSADGLYSFKITCPGGGGSNGGGQLDSYVSGTGGVLIPVNPLEDFWASWYYITNLATLSDKVEVLWYQENGSASAITPKSTLWSASSGQPTSAWQQNYGTILKASIPTDARFYSLRFTGGVAGASAGIVWYDNVKSGFQPQMRGIVQSFSSSGTFTPPSDCFRILVKMWGPGGAGAIASGAGGGGGYCEGFLDVIPGVPISVTVGVSGAPGTNSVVSSLTANHGVNAAGAGAFGAGGSASGGYINLTGQAGSSLGGGLAPFSSLSGNPATPGGGRFNSTAAGANGLVIITS
jgi:hypothetical protein